MSQAITSLANPFVKRATSLHQKKYRDQMNFFLIEGDELIRQAVCHGWKMDHVFVLEGHRPTFAIAEDELALVSQEILEKISKKENPQPVIAVFHKNKNGKLPGTIETIIPALEEIRDPGNLGTIIRSCHALGLKQLILIGNCCDEYAPEVVRATMGSFSAVEIIRVNLEEVIAWKKKNAVIRFIGTDVVKATDYRQTEYTGAVLLMGNEQRGLSSTLKNICDASVTIPMPGGTESLNVAMATTLLLYEAMRDKL